MSDGRAYLMQKANAKSVVERVSKNACPIQTQCSATLLAGFVW